jgi:hypothetical protein
MVVSKKPIRSSRAASATTSAGRTSGGRRSASSFTPKQDARVAKRSREIVEEEEEDDADDIDDGLDLTVDDQDDLIFDDEGGDEDFRAASRRRPPSSRAARSAAISKKRPARSRYADEGYDDDDEDFGRPQSRLPRSSGQGRRPGRPGAVVPYGRGPSQPAAFTRGIAAFRNSLPDPEKFKSAALTSIKAARETTSSLSTHLYRDIKGLTSSELEQVMLKSTRPDDTPVKGKHVERLVAVTYQINSRFDLYDSVLRKLWSKMTENDWRTTLKALYILHRYSSDGAPAHATSLKAKLRELRRTQDPKRKDKYFNTKQLLAGDTDAKNTKFRAFLSRYMHYVMMRAQCFSGMFEEIGSLPKVDGKKKLIKPMTATCLRSEHLNAAEILLKNALACQLKDGEDCENTAIAVERVASDLIGLTSATAMALNRALKEDDLKGSDPALLKKWCLFYKDELVPQTRAMVKRTSPKLDAYGLFLPSRMGASVARDLLEKGLSLPDKAAPDAAASHVDDDANGVADREKDEAPASKTAATETDEDDGAVDDVAELDGEYEYDDEEYYDDDEE